MSQQLTYLEGCIRDAKTDHQAVALLRTIVRGFADSAPVESLIKIGQTVVDLRRQDLTQHPRRN